MLTRSQVQKQCFNLNNFNSCMALSGALSSVAVHKLLKRELLEFSRSQRRWFEFFSENYVEHNKKGYRKRMAELRKPRFVPPLWGWAVIGLSIM